MPAFQVGNALAPAKGPLGFTDTFEFGGVGTVVHKIYTITEMSEHMDIIQSLWIDNSLNGNPLVINVNILGQVLRIPRYWQGVVPIFTILPLEMYAQTDSLNIIIPYILLNMPMPIGGWVGV